jgi:valyl-tRNA synthetase
MGKISKSRGGGPMPPLEMIEKYSADAVRYWAASTGLGKDAVISEKKIEMGQKLVNKLWNVARFSQRFLEDYAPEENVLPQLSPADRWILARAQRLVQRTTQDMRDYEHAAAKNEIETFFWTELADNYLEMAKMRLYGNPGLSRDGACFALHHTLLIVIKLFAPFLPHVTEQIHQTLYATDDTDSIHLSNWPVSDERFEDDRAEQLGETLVHIATAVRRYKSEHSLPLGAEIALLECGSGDDDLDRELEDAIPDLASITRAQEIRVSRTRSPRLLELAVEGPSQAALRV